MKEMSITLDRMSPGVEVRCKSLDIEIKAKAEMSTSELKDRVNKEIDSLRNTHQ